MNIRFHITGVAGLYIAIMIAIAALTASCIGPVGDLMREQRHAEAAARASYYGTGVVVRVIGSGQAVLTFKSPPLPATSATLIIVRDNKVVAKVKFGMGQSGNRYSCAILEGTPEEGDLALGWQRETDFTPHQPRRRQSWEKLP